MRYLIDGYNLIGKLPFISFSNPNKEEHLLQFLSMNMQKTKDTAQLVFDGKRVSSVFGSSYQSHKFRVFFTPTDQSADEFIIHKLAQLKNPSGLIVVSSDNEIIRAANQFRVKVYRCDEFLNNIPKKIAAEKPDRALSEQELIYWEGQFKKSKKNDPYGKKIHPKIF